MAGSSNDEWNVIGDEIKNTVMHAISTGDFSDLSIEVKGIAGQAVSQIEKQIRSGVSQTNYKGEPLTRYSSQNGPKPKTMYSSSKGNLAGDASGAGASAGAGASGGYQRVTGDVVRQRRYDANNVPQLYEKLTAQKVLSILGMAGGYSIGAILAVGAAGIFAVGHPFLATLFALLPAGFFALAGYSNAKFLQTGRFEKYVKALQGKTYASMQALADSVGRSVRYTLKDIQKMIGRKWFKQGHLDTLGTTLITSDASYGQYLETQANADAQRRLQEQQAQADRARKEKEDAEFAGMTESQKEMILLGESYIREIRRCNDEIPGEVISAKLDRLEYSARQIMARARKYPRYVSDLRRLMTYYFPTTVKLLDAYSELDKQEKTTENIEQSKREIEATIDTLNDAFDNIFNDMFSDTNLDISAETETMQNLLRRDGFVGEEKRMEMPGV